MGDIIFNITGGNNQILPNATEATQNFYGDQFAEAAQQHISAAAPANDTESENQLMLYLFNKVRAKEYILQLQSCLTAKEVGGVVATMVGNGDVAKEQAVKQVFIEKLLPFLGKVSKGLGIDNLRNQINDAMDEHKRMQKMQPPVR